MDPNDGTPMPGGTFLVIYSDYVVAGDIAETIKDFCPEADIMVKSQLGEIGTALISTEKIDVAFVEAGPEEWVASGLVGEIARRQGRVVLLGDAAEASAASANWPVLFRPFLSEDVWSHLGCQAGG